jgi:AraC-like DNA-binding protein
VRFEAEVSGIKFASIDLQRPIEGADPMQHEMLVTAMKEAETNGGMSFSDKVQGVLHQLVLSGCSSADDVARLFGIHERTLRRRLADDGHNLHELIQQTRFELAQQLLENTEIPVTGIAVALRYEDPNAFSRAFRAWAGLSPRQWRVEHKAQRHVQ